MIKRIPAIVFIILANVVLLAHAVIPHHHHEEEVCIVASHCESDSQAHDHDDAKHNHEHDGEDNVDDCVLQQILISPPNKIKHEIKSLNIDADRFQADHSQAISVENKFVLACFSSILKAKPPLLIFSYLNFASTVLGLRAPPIA